MTPYLRLFKAYKKGKGIRFSAWEVDLLMEDDAISQRAHMDAAVEKLPKDEADHFECLTNLKELFPHCRGDGWYRCAECGKHKQEG